MAKRRMFAMTIIDSDAFLDMPLSTQALYFHLNMRADDDGFVNNPKKIMRMIGAGEDEYKVLAAKNFIISFESGIIVIKHWKMHNIFRKDRHQATIYADEIGTLKTKANGAYTACIPNDNQMTTNGCPSLVKSSLVKSSLVNNKDEVKKRNPASKKIEIYILESEETNNLFIEYLTLRKKLKLSNSQTVITRLLNKLYDFASKGHLMDTTIINAITGSWKDFYEPKTKQSNNTQSFKQQDSQATNDSMDKFFKARENGFDLRKPNCGVNTSFTDVEVISETN